MNDLLGSNNYRQTEEQLNAKKWMKIIGVILVLLLILCITLVALMYYIKETSLKISIDGIANTKLQNVLLFEEDKIYVPIRSFAEFVGYESYNGDEKGEDKTLCFVRCANETASFTMGSNKIYKQLTNESDYEYYTLEEPVLKKNDVLYTTIEGAKRAFNITFDYDKKSNKITIYTLPYLVKYWSEKFVNSAIYGDKADFSNQKAILDGMIVLESANQNYGVYDLNGKEILGTKYKKIRYIESKKEFIITTTENKMGIMAYDSTTKIKPEYDLIKQIDKDTGLYLVTKNRKQGVVNNNGSIIVHIEYDQIGIDINKYSSLDIKNQYLLYDNCIPAKRNNKWGMFDKLGREILPVEYEDFGCSVTNATSGNQTIADARNVLLIPEVEGIVVKKSGLYGLIDSNGDTLLPIVLQTVYAVTSEGKTTYKMVYNKQERDIIDYIKKYVRPTNNNTVNENTNTTDTSNTNNTSNSVNNTTNVNTPDNVQNSNNQVQNNNTISTNANTVTQNNTTSYNNTVTQNVY